MAPLPQSPSFSLPGAWPASPSPKLRVGQQERNAGDPHYLRSSQRSADLHYRKASVHRTAQTRINSGTIGPIPDNTLTSTASGDLSLQPSRANTSFSSAYTSPTTPNTSLSPKTPDNARQRDESKMDAQKTIIGNDPIGHRNKDPCPLLVGSLEGIETYTDQTFLSLPEIPDLASLSSLREEFRISRGEFSVSDSRSSRQVCLDESFFEAHTISMQQESFDTLSSSSIQFRQTNPLPIESLDMNAKSLRFPQPDGRDSWTLFLSPRSISSEGLSIPRVTPKTLVPTLPTESGCETTNPGPPAIRRSWRASVNPPYFSRLQHEDTSTTQYARDILERAFGVDGVKSNLVLTTPRGASSPTNFYTLPATDATQPEAIRNNSPDVHLPRRAKILHTVKRIRQKVRGMLEKLAAKDYASANYQDKFATPQSPCQHSTRAPTTGSAQQAFPQTHWCQSEGLYCPSATACDTQSKQDRLDPEILSHVPHDKTQWQPTEPSTSTSPPTHHDGFDTPRKLNIQTPFTRIHGSHILQTPTGRRKRTSVCEDTPEHETFGYASKKPEKINSKQRRSLFRLSFHSDRKH